MIVLPVVTWQNSLIYGSQIQIAKVEDFLDRNFAATVKFSFLTR